MPKVACVMMQRDETEVLEPWLAYHGHLFGLENLSVIDHGSKSPKVREILGRYERKGVFVDRSHVHPKDYARKGEIVGDRMRTLDALGTYDFLFPLDCDEFVARRAESGFTCDKASIHESLAALRDEARTLRISFQFANVPGRPDFYCHFPFQKTFFAADSFGWTDHGHHFEGSWKAPGFRETDIAHIHFHNKPHRLLIEHARRKLGVHVDPDQVKGLGTYTGRSQHLVPYLQMTEAAYHAQFDQQVQFYCPGFLARIRALGAPIPFGEASPSSLQSRGRVTRPAPKPAATERAEAAGRAEVDGQLMMLPVRFDQAEYLAANPDVAAAGVDPLVHFCKFGFKEGRRLRPR